MKLFHHDHELTGLGVTGHKRIIFDLFRRDMNLDNVIYLNAEIRREYMACTNSKADPLQAMKHHINALQKAGVIVRYKRATYRVNPRYGIISKYKENKIIAAFKEEKAAQAAIGLD